MNTITIGDKVRAQDGTNREGVVVELDTTMYQFPVAKRVRVKWANNRTWMQVGRLTKIN